MSKEGTYTITYTAKDSAGNTATAERTVKVTNALFEDRVQISRATNNLVGGVKEYKIVSNNGLNWENTSYFSEVNLVRNPNIKIVSCYGAYDSKNWKMTKLSDQAAAAQGYFDKTKGYENYKIVGILNADAYNMSTGEPLGALVMNGIKYHDAGRTPYFAILKDGTAVIRDSSVSLGDCLSAVGGFEIIVKDGVIKPGLNSSLATISSRTAVGIKEDGTVVTMVTHGFTTKKSYGFTIYQVAEYMKSMGCVDVLNLDGGGSSEWCSMYEGTNELIVRNTPSDGYERHVASSILIVSTEAGDGGFEHATITPATSIYTPNSTVAFTATGVDSAGGAADIPGEAVWSLADDSYGTIDKQGVFVSNGKTGDVTVQLCYDNTVVGTSTIMIKEPDSIKFGSPEISIGRGKESNLGIEVSYQGRTVNYNAGDLIWSLSNNDMGVVNTKTDTFTASPDLTMTGTITIISKYDSSVSGSVVVNVGQDPTVAMDFEDHSDNGTLTPAYTYWGADNNGKIVGRAIFSTTGGVASIQTSATGMITTGFYGRGGQESAEIIRRADGYPVHLGSNALKINYDMSAATGTEGANVGLTKDYLIPGNPSAIGLWVYVPNNTPNLWLRVRLSIVDANGNTTATTQFNFTEECKGAFTTKGTYGGLSDVEPGSWKFLSADLSQYAGSRFKMPAGETIRIMWTTGSLITSQYNSRTDVTSSNGIYLSDGRTINKADCVGSIYVDDLMFIYGSINKDAKAPTVTSFTANDNDLSNNMTFNTETINFKAIFKDEDDEDNMVKASGIDKSNVYMYIDGQSMENAVVDNEGMIKLDGVCLANGEHSVKLLVCDNNGNEKKLTYYFVVEVANSQATTVQLVSKQREAVLGKSIDLDVTCSDVSKVDAITMTLQIDSKYQDSYTISAGNGYTIDNDSIKYDNVHHTVTFTANRTANASSNGNSTIAAIRFAIPSTIAEGSCFVYSVAAGSITYVSNYSELNQPSFSSLKYNIPVVAPYTISSDVIVAGMSGSYFYIKNTTGAAVPGVPLYFTDGSEIGTTDAEGKLAVPNTINNTAASFTIYAKDNNGNVSFGYTGQSYAPGGAENDGSPVYILNNAASDGSTVRNLTWQSNPVHSQEAAKVRISDSEANIETGNVYSGTSKLLAFKGSANASENYATRINGVTIKGLIPGATYYYQVGDGTKWSAADSFTMPNQGQDTNIFILGDVQAEDQTNIKTILEKLKNDEANYDLGIQTGDEVELASLYLDWTKSLDLMNGLKSNQVMLHTLGNHELTGESGEKITSAIYNLENPSYYSVNYGSIYVATISYMSSMSDYETVLKWLVQDASKSNAPHKILVMHQPAYYTNVTDPSNAELHKLLPAYAEQAGIDFVFSGHDHSYARTNEINGVTYYICGTSGEKAYPVTKNPDFNFAVVTGDFTATYLTVKANKNSITVTTYDLVDGTPTIIDTYTKIN